MPKNNVTKLQETNESPGARSGKMNGSFGTSGTKIFEGFYDEEFLGKLRGTDQADQYDEMTRTDAQIQMLLSARKNPILNANWFIEAAGDDEAQVKHKDFIDYELFDRAHKPFKATVTEILSFVDHGWAILERIHEVVNDDPRFGQFIGLKNLGWRSQRTIEEWRLNRDGSIKEVFQQADGDLDNFAPIPGEFITVFTLGKVGDNYEGISALRPIFGNYFRKRIYQKLMAIGIERYAVGTPIGKIPLGKEETTERTIFETMLKTFTSHQKSYLLLPSGWEVDFTKDSFDADKVTAAIQAENLEMAKSFVAQHLELGTGGNTGAYALATDLSDQFLSIIQTDADIIAQGFNHSIIKELIDINFGKQAKYPKLRVTGINDKLGKEFADIVKILSDAKAITLNNNLEIFLRKAFKMPELTEQEKIDLENKPRDPNPPSFFSERRNSRVTLAERAQTKRKNEKILNQGSQVFRKLMQSQLKDISDKMIDRIGNKLKKAPKSKWQVIARNEELTGLKQYKDALTGGLVIVSTSALGAARSIIPGGDKIKLASTFDKQFKELPPQTREMIKTEVSLLADTQASDIEKNILFALTGNINTTEDANILIDDMKESRNKYLTSPAVVAAAGNAVASIFNQTQIEFYQAPDVLEQIEAFEFINADPVSPICKDLSNNGSGQIFRKDDPQSARFLPPLHHNCKSYILPVFILKPDDEAKDLRPSKSSLEKFITI